MESVKDKVVLITGSSSGIGAATAVEFAKYGSRLVLTGRNEANLKKTAENCTNVGLLPAKIKTVIGDVTIDEHLGNIVEQAVATFGTIDILVNNVAGGFGKMGSTQGLSMDDFDLTYRTSLRSVVYLTKLVIPHLKKSQGVQVRLWAKWIEKGEDSTKYFFDPETKFQCINNIQELLINTGSIVNNSSVLGIRAGIQATAYSMMKAAMDMFTKDLALELAADGIRVNSVNPGFIETPGFAKNYKMTNEELKKYYETCSPWHPLGRMGQVDEVARSIVFLASAASSFTTGALFSVDGGISQTSSWTPKATPAGKDT